VRHNTRRFAEFFEHLLASDEPTVFHGTAGKDRTGFAAAMILLALGISRDAVMEDYLLTNRCYRAPAAPPDARVPTAAREVLWGVRAEFLAAALDVIDTDCGGVDAYLDSQLGMGPTERARLAQAYLSD
jgi:protein-tyrosine phosphatase